MVHYNHHVCMIMYSVLVCTEQCKDKDPQCGRNPGWPKNWCTDKNVFGGMMYATVNEKCPKMCGHCGQFRLPVSPYNACVSLADRTYVAVQLMVRVVVCLSVVICNVRIVAKRCEIGHRLLLITYRKSHISFQMT